MNNIPTWVSAGAATLSLIFTVVSWYLSNKSKKAKEKAEAAHQATLDMCAAAQRSAQAAEERVEQVKKSLEQMQQIIPEFELTNVGGTTFELHNVTMDPIKILEVVNIRQFVHRENLKETIEREFGPGEMVQVDLNRYEEDDNLRLRIEGRDNTLCIPIKRLRR